MSFRSLPLALALAVTLGAVGACARDAQVPTASTVDGQPAPAASAARIDPPAPAYDHHVHAPADVDAPVPDGHQPWAPDAPLLEGMARVRAAVAALEAAPAPAEAAGHVAEVDEAVGYIFANCSLDPEPDAALHGVLARLMAASRALRTDPADAAAVSSMRAAIDNYQALFDDPAG